MVETVSKSRLASEKKWEKIENLKENLRSLIGGRELLNLVEATSLGGTIWAFESAKQDYKIGNDEISLKKEFKFDKEGVIKEAKFTINKLIKGNVPRITTYELTATCIGDNEYGVAHVNYALRTDDGMGQKDLVESIPYGDFLNTIIQNFGKRYKECEDYHKKEAENQEKRMQELANNDQDEADDMLGNLNQFYDA